MKADRIAWGLFWALFIFSGFNILLMNQLGGGDKHPAPAPGAPEVVVHDSGNKDDTAKSKDYDLVPADPADYGIVAIPQAKLPRSQIEWEVQMSHLLEDSGILERDEGKEAVGKMQTSPQKFADTESKIDKEIAAMEDRFQDEPFNAKLENRLQTLYKLKAIGNIMKKRVTTLGPDQYKMLRDRYNLPPE